MEIEYDKEIDAKYVRIKKGTIAHTKKEEDWLLFDYAENGDVLGIEILDASEHLVSVFTVKEELLGYSIAEEAVGSDKESLRVTINSPEHVKENQFVSA